MAEQRESILQTTGFKIAVFVVGTILLGALLSPPLYWGGKLLVEKEWIKNIPVLDSIHGSMDRAKFSRYFNRGILAGALLMLFPTLRWLNAGRNSGSSTLRERLQVRANPQWLQHLLGGFALAAGGILLLGWFYVSKEWYTTRELTKPLVKILFSAILSGAVVACLEEFVFRGALTSIFSKLLKPLPLLFSIAAFFALVHFLKPPQGADITDVKALSGFHMLSLIFSQFGNLYFLAAEFLVLFSIGIVLGYTRLKTGSLWLGIGLHAGWVFGVKTLSPMTARNFEPAAMMPWLGNNLRVGLVSAVVVCLTGLVVFLWVGRKKSVKV